VRERESRVPKRREAKREKREKPREREREKGEKLRKRKPLPRLMATPAAHGAGERARSLAMVALVQAMR
jgi:hypothetical protein